MLNMEDVLRLTSKIRTDLSEEHEAKTFSSVWLHCRSSTEERCPWYGRASTAHVFVPLTTSHTWMVPVQSPVVLLKIKEKIDEKCKEKIQV
jgi:hypothetical protein